MKVTATRPVPVEPEVTLTLTHAEARLLKTAMFIINWDESPMGKFAEELSNDLSDVDVSTHDYTLGDHDATDIEVKLDN